MSDLLWWIVPIVGFGAALWSFANAAIALHAKSRLHRLILQRASTDRALEELLRLADKHAFRESEVENARRAIMGVMQELSERDRRFVEKGMEQTNRIGQKRYLRDLVRAA